MKNIAIVVLSTLILAGCGGGGSNNKNNKGGRQMQTIISEDGSKDASDGSNLLNHGDGADSFDYLIGQYTGVSQHRSWTTTVLSSGAIYMAYQFKDRPDTLAGFVSAHGVTTNNSYIGILGNDFNFKAKNRCPTFVSGTYITGKSLSSALKYLGMPKMPIEQAFETRIKHSASLESLSGTYNGTMFVAETLDKRQSSYQDDISLTFDTNGTMTGHSSRCQLTGKATPEPATVDARPTNAFQLDIAFSAGPNCPIVDKNLRISGVIVPRIDNPTQIDILMDRGLYTALIFSGSK